MGAHARRINCHLLILFLTSSIVLFIGSSTCSILLYDMPCTIIQGILLYIHRYNTRVLFLFL